MGKGWEQTIRIFFNLSYLIMLNILNIFLNVDFMNGPVEPFKIKMVEQVRIPDEKRRSEAIKEAGYNLSLIHI